jgi:hypothetical protein
MNINELHRLFWSTDKDRIKQLKNKKNMEITIDGILHEFDVDKAKELGILTEKIKYPSWSDVCEKYLKVSEIEYSSDSIYGRIYALNKVLIMREAWLRDIVVDKNANYYYISQHYDRLNVFAVMIDTYTFHKDYPLTFPTREMAERFLEEFKDDLLNCKIFL